MVSTGVMSNIVLINSNRIYSHMRFVSSFYSQCFQTLGCLAPHRGKNSGQLAVNNSFTCHRKLFAKSFSWKYFYDNIENAPVKNIIHAVCCDSRMLFNFIYGSLNFNKSITFLGKLKPPYVKWVWSSFSWLKPRWVQFIFDLTQNKG